jgi:hypothetical protein
MLVVHARLVLGHELMIDQEVVVILVPRYHTVTVLVDQLEKCARFGNRLVQMVQDVLDDRIFDLVGRQQFVTVRVRPARAVSARNVRVGTYLCISSSMIVSISFPS